MKNLNIIQKVFKVFKTLSFVAMILAFVGAGVSFVSGIVLMSGGELLIAKIGETKIYLPILFSVEELALGNEKLGAFCMSVFAGLLCEGILFTFACRYFVLEQKEGTPFTEKGVVTLRNIGISAIVLSVISATVHALICKFAEIPESLISNYFDASAGICLILFSLIIRYGAELEKKSEPLKNDTN